MLFSKRKKNKKKKNIKNKRNGDFVKSRLDKEYLKNFDHMVVKVEIACNTTLTICLQTKKFVCKTKIWQNYFNIRKFF